MDIMWLVLAVLALMNAIIVIIVARLRHVVSFLHTSLSQIERASTTQESTIGLHSALIIGLCDIPDTTARLISCLTDKDTAFSKAAATILTRLGQPAIEVISLLTWTDGLGIVAAHESLPESFRVAAQSRLRELGPVKKQSIQF